MRNSWDQAYTRGLQDGWEETESSPRFALIGGLCKQCCVTNILDVGCGIGLLRASLCLNACHYTGLDCSSVAIQCIKEKGAGEFICADAEDWAPSRHYDAVILNEVLYYFANPRVGLSKYYEAVAPSGILIVSIWKRPATLLRSNINLDTIRIAEALFPFSKCEVSDGVGTWAVLMLKKPPQP
jgi:2-polyprenyl-3-methyl-5-hydroxy-6-metoxy-1,4-benzoquinol methylase